jgi:opacity protein-like surface antigen
MKKLILIIVAPFLLITNSMSLDLGSITPKIGISGNQSVHAATGTERAFREGGAGDTTTDEHGAFKASYPSIFVELAVGPVALGLDYVVDDLSTPEITTNEGNANQNKVQVDFTDLTTLYAKLDIPLGGLYLKVGYSQVDVIVNEVMNSGNTYKNTDTAGYTAGLGYEINLDSGMSIRAEVTGMQFEKVTADNGVLATGGTSANGGRNEISVDDMIGARGTISIVKAF